MGVLNVEGPPLKLKAVLSLHVQSIVNGMHSVTGQNAMLHAVAAFKDGGER